MKKSLASIAIVAVLLTTSCYHARVETGLQPSSKWWTNRLHPAGFTD